MFEETSDRVEQLITELYRELHINKMTKNGFVKQKICIKFQFSTPSQKYKLIPVGRPIISGVSGLAERLSAFVDKLLQLMAQQQKSYFKDSTSFINFVEGTRPPENRILVSMDVMSLYTTL